MRPDDKKRRMEQAEGSTEQVNPGSPDPALLGGNAGEPMERGAGQESQPDKPIPSKDERDAGGISNRPLSEEERNQERLPDRGSGKAEHGGRAS